MVRADFELGAMQVAAPVDDGFFYAIAFELCGTIVPLGGVEPLSPIRHYFLNFFPRFHILFRLEENSADAFVRRVYRHGVVFFWVVESQYFLRAKSIFQILEGFKLRLAKL